MEVRWRYTEDHIKRGSAEWQLAVDQIWKFFNVVPNSFAEQWDFLPKGTTIIAYTVPYKEGMVDDDAVYAVYKYITNTKFKNHGN